MNILEYEMDEFELNFWTWIFELEFLKLFEHWGLEMCDLPLILKSTFLKKEWNSQFKYKQQFSCILN